jgi:Na+-driven multidrug efflux pump
MMVLLIPSVLNIILDAWFIVELNMGLEGAAMATAISQFVGSVLGFAFFAISHDALFPRLREMFTFKYYSSIASLGSVQFLSQGAMSVVVLIANHMLFKYGGDLAISAYGLILRLMMFAFFPVIGIVQGIMPVIGFNFGANNPERVSQSIRLALRTSTLIGLLTTLLAFLAAPNIIGLFTNELDLIKLGSVALYWFFSAFPLLGIQKISISYFQAIGKAKPALLLSLLKQGILIPLMLTLPLFYGLDGIWYSLPITEVLATAAAYAYFRQEVKSQVIAIPVKIIK